MAQKPVPELKEAFENNKTPDEQDFNDVFDSYFHKSTKINQSQILGLGDTFATKADKSDLDSIVGGMINKGEVPTIIALPAIAVKGWAYIVKAEKDPVSGLSYIFQYDGVLWNNTKLTAFPSDVARMSEAFTSSVSNADIILTYGVYRVDQKQAGSLYPYTLWVYPYAGKICQARTYPTINDIRFEFRTFDGVAWTSWTDKFVDQSANLSRSLALVRQGADEIQYYGDARIYWDAKTHKLYIDGAIPTTGGNKVVVRILYNGKTIRITNDVLERAITNNGNFQLLLPLSDNVSIDYTLNDIIIQEGTSWNAATHLKIGHLIFASGMSSALIITKNVATDNYILTQLSNVQWYGEARIYWDSSLSKLSIIGNVPSDFGSNIVVRFFYNGKDVRINNTIFERKLILDSNKILVLPVPTEPTTIYSLNDIIILDGVTYDTSKYIRLNHVIFGKGISEGLIKQYSPAIATKFVYQRDTFDILKTLKSSDKDCSLTVFWGDSIFASGFKDSVFPDENGNSLYEQPPRCASMQSFNRMLYFQLNGNKHKWRNALHTDWQYTGTAVNANSGTMPNNNEGGVGNATQYDKLKQLQAGATARIIVTGAKKAIFFFQGGRDAYATGNFTVKVSKDGGAFVSPSSLLKGRTNKKGFGTSKGYDVAKDTIQTSFVDPFGLAITSYNRYSAYQKEAYNGLDENSTYTFEFTSVGVGYLWGCCTTKEDQVHLVYNNAKPGFAWSDLRTTMTNDILVPEADLVILESPMYHDFNETQANNGFELLVPELLKRNVKVVLCSCPSGGVIITGRATPILGDENGAAYYPGQNFVKYYNSFRYFNYKVNLTNLNQSPQRKEVYRCIIDNVIYDCECCLPTQSNTLTRTALTVPKTFPSTIPTDTVFTRITANAGSTSVESFTAKSMDAYLTMSMHRDLMKQKADKYGLPFIDLLEAFNDMAHSVGEEVDTDGWDMSPEHPLYNYVNSLVGSSSYPTLQPPFKMNYASNFFDIGDGHHLAYPAHEVVYEIIKVKCFRG